MKQTVFLNGQIFADGTGRPGTLTVESGLITGIHYGEHTAADFAAPYCEIIDCAGKMILPGVIDEHVHFRDPGLTHKGDMSSESRAAIAGGVTSFFDMPNTLPQTTDRAAWMAKMRRAAEVSYANYAFFPGVTDGNIGDLLSNDFTRIPGLKLFLGSSTGNMLVNNPDLLRRLFSSFRGVICVHAEDEDTINANRRRLEAKYPGGIPVGCHEEMRSAEACYNATRQVVELARETGARLHVMHVSTAAELEFFTPGPIAGKQITAETCPHYLTLTAESVEATGGLTKCNPALKADSDRKALLEAVADGRIDIIASDHAPHLLEEKTGRDLLGTPSGMPSVQFILPVMLELARQGYFSVGTVVERMASNPAALYGVCRRGAIKTGNVADMVIVDPDADYEVKRTDVISRCGWSPYEGMRLHNRVAQTWLNGSLAYADGVFPEKKAPALAIRFEHC